MKFSMYQYRKSQKLVSLKLDAIMGSPWWNHCYILKFF